MSPLYFRDAEQAEIGERLPVLPLRDLVLFPYVVTPLLVGRPATLGAIEAAMAEERWVLLVAQRAAEVEEPAAADLHRTGVVGRILQVNRLPNGTAKVLVEGFARARVSRYAPAAGHLRAVAVPAPLDGGAESDADAAQGRAVLELFEEYVALHRRLPDEVTAMVQGAPTLPQRAYGVAAHLTVAAERKQDLLEIDALETLLRRLVATLTSEIELLRLERKIDDDVRGTLFRNQREFYLQEQLKAIHRELGEDDADDLAELETQVAAKTLPEAVRGRAMRELRRLRRMSPMSPESTVARGFLDWIVALPWTERSSEHPDVAKAREALDADHHGLEDVKERILDYIAVLALVEKPDAPILCLVGPPGVGKTSLGRSIARALGRSFARMSLGGVRDEAEIRGHRRTYIGAMPGRVIQAMRRAAVVNPVLLLDEIDKLGHDYRGDPAAALLEVLDPEQNRAFSDHYLEVDYDLSQVLFVTTANSLAGIPEPLRDRMEIIRLPGYLDQEKLAIARRFLLPRQLERNGLDARRVEVGDDVLRAIMRGYTREAGVRELERRIARLARKLARQEAERAPHDAAAPLVVEAGDLHALLGAAPYDDDDTSLDDKVGVACGLAYTSVGGETLEIEVTVLPGRGKLALTGTLGDVMKESASAAMSYVRSRAVALGIERDFHRTRDIHIHIPAGATPKDGPSAGIAIAIAVASALTGIPVRGDVAMTGEVTLRGRVLAIGGLKEKAVAAHRCGIRHVIIPHGNARELDEIPEEVRSSVVFHPVKTMDEVVTIALRAQPSAAREGAAATTH
ncbi:MAG: endopeptidase La [Gemmatimonadaceae bacterium]|nr:endopeptidase La [Gemmatimonadaceae bacterium]NUR18719.1 endopeptidase La [Gemmatimonadaceae bacterium]